MAEILDLSVLLGNVPKQVRLSPEGRVYKLPPDCPAELYFLLLQFWGLKEDEVPPEELVVALHDQTLELFQVYQPDMERLPAEVSIPVLVQLVGRVYGEQEEDPTPAKGGGKATPGTRKRTSRASGAKKATRSRSSSS
jgi:hypothetical protein